MASLNSQINLPSVTTMIGLQMAILQVETMAATTGTMAMATTGI
jgi:hypothetical protein